MLTPKELLQIETLLKENKLPYEDIVSSKVIFFSKKKEDTIIGCIGIEEFGTDALLRSFAVSDAFKGKAIGKELLTDLLEYLKSKHFKTVHLLTTTAASYFSNYGFVVSTKNTAPESIKNTQEFTSICPDSAIYMTLGV